MSAEEVPQPGWIGLTRIAGDVGFLIRVGQWLNRCTWKFWTWRKLWKKAKYEHAFMVTRVVDRPGIRSPNLKQVFIMEAEPGGAVERPFHYDPATVLWLRPPDAATGLLAARKALQLEGTPYSFLDYLAIFLRRLGFCFRWLYLYISNCEHMICSQLVDHAAELAGWHLFGKQAVPPSKDIVEGFVTPEMEAELAMAQGATK